jgi:ClpA/ClpB-like protein
MGHPFVGSEHLLLAIVDSDDTVAAHRVLRESGALKQYLSEIFGE